MVKHSKAATLIIILTPLSAVLWAAGCAAPSGSVPGPSPARAPAAPATSAGQPFPPATGHAGIDPSALAQRPFRDCLRRHGISVPEPGDEGVPRYPTAPAARDASEYRAAEEACRHLVDDPAAPESS